VSEVFLTTERLVLRRFTPADEDDLVDLNSDPDVVFYINGGRPIPRAEIRDDLSFHVEYYDSHLGFGHWAADERATGEFLGWFHFRPRRADPPDQAELGYRLRRSAWGRGYATEGSRALIARGFTDFGVNRVYAETMVVNTGSRRVMEKAGLRQIRVFHQEWPDHIPGDELGDVEYALTRAEWLATR
jgi:RimJ/RimL family protein N-acetyltransferase